MRNKNYRNKRKNDNKTYIKCEICGSHNISVVAISPKDSTNENGKTFDVKMGWLAICNDCNSQVIVTERWITPTKLVKDLSDLEIKNEENNDLEFNQINPERINKLMEIIEKEITKNKND